MISENAGVDERLAYASTLSASLYHSPAALQIEKERIFSGTWQLVARADEVAAPEQYVTATVANEPILVARGVDNQLRAFSNVCRHRAGPVAKGRGSCPAFRCGYHGWSYALDGRLLGTPEFEGVEEFRREENGLPEFRVESWLGLVFVNLNPQASSLKETLGALWDRLENRDLGRMRSAARREWTLDCNWKVYVDNYLEGYHIPIVHPSLMKQLDYSRYRTELGGFHSRQHAPLRGRDEQAEYYWLFPNLMLNVYAGNFSTNLILPLGPDRTVTIFEWFFAETESAEARAEIEKVVEVSEEIQLEDIAICEAVQKGLASRTYDRGRFSPKRESGVHHFHRLYAAFAFPPA